MNIAKKIAAVLLMLCMLVPVLVSCGGSGDNTTAANGTDTNALALPNGDQVGTGDGGVVDMSGVLEIPEGVTFDGDEFTFLTGSLVTTCPYIFTVDEEDNAIDEAIYRRNLTIEEKYDILIVEERVVVDDNGRGSGAAFTKISQAHESGDAIYNAAVSSPYDCGTLSMGGYLADLRDYGYINLDKVWWDQAANKQLTIYDRTYFTAGDISYIDDNFTYALAFNKEMAKSLDFDNMYDLVTSGKWTYDKLYQVSKLATVPDGDPAFTANDIYGFIGYPDCIWMSFSSTGATVAAIDDSGELALNFNSEKNYNMLIKFTEFGASESFLDWMNTAGAKDWKGIYSRGQALFFGATIDGIYKLRNTDLDYGLIPWPKYDEEQEHYNSGMSPNHISLFCIPSLGDDEHIEMSSILVEAIACASDIVVEGFYEHNLRGKAVRDNESYETLDLVFANKVFDLGYYYNIGGFRGGMSIRFKGNRSDYASLYSENEIKAKTRIQEINDLYKGLLDD